MKEIRGQLFTPAGEFLYGKIEVEEDIIKSVTILNREDLTDDERERFIIPGLVDIHTHGCASHDTCGASYEGELAIVKYMRSHGITSFCPTTMTLSEETLTDVCANIARVAKECPEIKGIYLEGPFISEKKKGAQNADYIQTADADMLGRLNKAADGLIKIVAIAPETEGAIDVIRDNSKDYKFSIAHTDCDYDIAKQAIEAGANHVTHLYNAMPAYSHRAPGVIGAAADSADTRVELICDGIHVHPAVIRNTFKLFGNERVVLISDSMEATGMPDGQYSLGGQTVIMQNRKATLVDGTIAGSASNLFDCLTFVINNGVDRSSAIMAATRNPAREIGIYDKVGSIEAGKRAELLVLDSAFGLDKVIQNENDIN